MRPWSPEYRGRLEEREIESAALGGNPLGDPAIRPIWVYLPPLYDEEPAAHFPVIYFLQGFAAALPRWAQRPAFGRTVPERVDAVFSDGTTPPCIVVYVDAWTSFGGSQFVDSPAVGNYHTYLCEDVVDFVDQHYRTRPEPAHRGLQGHSSGGFGAIVNAMLRPDRFGGVASHAGDSAYELCYPPEIATAYRALHDRYDRSYDRFFAALGAGESLRSPADFSLIMVYALAACFSADPDGTVQLPFDPLTGQLVPQVFERWLAWDPARMVSRYAEACRSLRAIWIDAGRSDEYYFDIGAETLAAELQAIGVNDAVLELFDGGHGRIEDRYAPALRFLAGRLTTEK